MVSWKQPKYVSNLKTQIADKALSGLTQVMQTNEAKIAEEKMKLDIFF